MRREHEQSVVGRKGAGVSDVRAVAQPGHREPPERVSHDPRAELRSVPYEFRHGRNDGRQVRCAESVEISRAWIDETLDLTIQQWAELRERLGDV